MELAMDNRNCMSYWFTRLRDSGAPVPETILIDAGGQWTELINVCDGKKPQILDTIASRIREAATLLGGYPVFLRTGLGSGKHEWTHTCYVTDPDRVEIHVAGLVEWSEMVDFMGLPYRWWAVRKFLKLKHSFTAFGGMPVSEEWRGFVSDGDVVCVHPYWPIEALIGYVDGAFRPDRETLERVETDTSWRAAHSAMFDHDPPRCALDLIGSVAKTFDGDGAWSVDVCVDENGDWYVTDMAEAHRSYHFPGCEHEKTHRE